MKGMRLLLISNSTLYGSGYLDHCASAIERFLRPDVRRVLFVPYALYDCDGYASRARERFARTPRRRRGRPERPGRRSLPARGGGRDPHSIHRESTLI